jgi:pimeloyl-ACP methyl ester carboxylesterase
MIRDTAVGLRFGRSWLSGHAEVEVAEIELDRGDRVVPATLYRPLRRPRRPSGWIAFHGATVPGRAHSQLVRFARAVAHAGGVVVVPEVPEWAALQLAPAMAVPTTLAALPALRARVGEQPVGLLGFSFGAPQAITAAAHPALAGRIAGVAAFGGYCELASTFRFLFLGEHEWEGRRYETRVDPYGRWIVGGNYLHRTPGFEDTGDVAAALRELAAEAGSARVPSWDPHYDPRKGELAARIAPARRALFDVFAPRSDTEPDRALAERLIEAMVGSVRRVDPLMDPADRLGAVRVPVRLMHGRGDALIPFTETLRMERALAGITDVRATVTPLFAHTNEDDFPGIFGRARESGRFVRFLGSALRMVGR